MPSKKQLRARVAQLETQVQEASDRGRAYYQELVDAKMTLHLIFENVQRWKHTNEDVLRKQMIENG